MADDVPRDDKGHLMPGAKLNPGGRAGKRQRDFAKALMVDTDDLATTRQKLLKLMACGEPRVELRAVELILQRTLGQALPAPLPDEEGEALPSESEMLAAAEKYIAEAKARLKEKSDGKPAEEPHPAEAPAGELPVEVGEVQQPGPLPGPGQEPLG